MNSEASENKVVLDGNGSPSVTLTIRLIMQGKEVGSIIGKKGDNIKKFREESGAKINISDGSCPERIVTVTGSTECILKAFALIASKFEEDIYAPAAAAQQLSQQQTGQPTTGNTQGKPQVTLRLVVPASQCGSLIGKGGAKIKEIREMTGATIQVASEMLPNSTERAVTISGNSDAITKCIYQICCVMMESPPKGATIPYRPKPAMPPVIFAGGQAYTIQGQYAIPHPDLTKLHQLALQHTPLGGQSPQQTQQSVGHHPNHHQGVPQTQHHPSAVAAAYHAAGLSPQAAALANLAAANSAAQQPMMGPSSQMNQSAVTGGPNSTSELSIPNELIGCIIGKGGAKINEIRQLSGATIKISNTEEGSKDRTVVIAGTPESINLAQYLINTSMELHKHVTLDASTAASLNLNLNPNPSSMSSSMSGLPSIASSVTSSLASSTSSSILSSSSSHSIPMSLSHLVPSGVLSADNPCLVSSSALNPMSGLTSNLHHNQSSHLNQLLNPSLSSNNSSNNMPNSSTSHLSSALTASAALAAAQSLFSNASSSEVLSGQHLSQQLQQQQSLFQSQYNLNAFSTNMNRVKSNLVTKVRAGVGLQSTSSGITGVHGVHASLLNSLNPVSENGNKTKADRKFAPY